MAVRLAMMVRKVSFTYRNSYQMHPAGLHCLAWVMPSDRRRWDRWHRDLTSPSVWLDDGYIEKARDNDWLLCNDSIATPATTSKTENLQLRATLEPVKDFKIDLSATRTKTTQKSIQYMYEGTPTTQSGTFQMTTISLGSAFEGMGNANQWLSQQDLREVCQLAGWFPPEG